MKFEFTDKAVSNIADLYFKNNSHILKYEKPVLISFTHYY